jgi:cysteine desulfurase
MIKGVLGMIYLDNSATTKPYPEVIETYKIASEQFFANPSSIHKLGGRSEDLLNKSRQLAADLLGVKPHEIIFTSGGTEGNNFAIKGTALGFPDRGKHLITTKVEHPASLRAFEQLEALGFNVTYLDVDRDGRISVDDLKAALRDDTLLVSIIHVNNELGTIQPVEEIGQLLKKRPKTLFHIDHVQGYTKVPLDFREAGIDLCTISGHKIHGPKGTGILYKRESIKLSPLLAGGGQEHGFRSGTENLPAIAALVKAMRMTKERSQAGIKKMETLTKTIRKTLEKHPRVIINTPEIGSAPHILNLAVRGIRSEVLVHALDKDEIYISTKSACSSKENEASPVLLATGMAEEDARHSVRISLAFDNTEEEIESFLETFMKKVDHLEKVME